MHRKHKLILTLTLIAGTAFVVMMIKLKLPPERAPERSY